MDTREDRFTDSLETAYVDMNNPDIIEVSGTELSKIYANVTSLLEVVALHTCTAVAIATTL